MYGDDNLRISIINHYLEWTQRNAEDNEWAIRDLLSFGFLEERTDTIDGKGVTMLHCTDKGKKFIEMKTPKDNPVEKKRKSRLSRRKSASKDRNALQTPAGWRRFYHQINSGTNHKPACFIQMPLKITRLITSIL